MLKPLETDITQITTLLAANQEIIGGRAFYPIADVANRLFLTDNVPHRDDVFAALAKTNRKIVGLTFCELAEIPVVILNAGGDHKLQAIRTVLGFRRPKSSDPFVTVLCTDSRTAGRLLEAAMPVEIMMSDLPGEN